MLIEAQLAYLDRNEPPLRSPEHAAWEATRLSLQSLAALDAHESGTFGRDDLPGVMVYTAQICTERHERKFGGYHQVVLFADHQRAMDRVKNDQS